MTKVKSHSVARILMKLNISLTCMCLKVNNSGLPQNYFSDLFTTLSDIIFPSIKLLTLYIEHFR